MKKITIKILGLTEVIEYTKESKRTYSAVKEWYLKGICPIMELPLLKEMAKRMIIDIHWAVHFFK